jgi:hypothetical protein
MYLNIFIGFTALTAISIFSIHAFAQETEISKSPFRLEALVDFPDDALETVITPAHVDAMMVTLHEMGVTRVSWGYYGDGHGGYMLPSGLSNQWRNYADTLKSIENPLLVAVEAAHRHGLEIYAYYKPYETGPAISLPDGSPEARAFGRIRQQGGWLTWMDPFVADHPNLRIRHKPDDSIKNISNVPICSIKLVKKDDSPTRITKEHLQIWSSQFNYRYQKLNVDFTIHEMVEASPQEVRDINGVLVTKKGAPVRTLTLSGFRLTDPYILVTTDFTDGQSDFDNTGTNLFVAFDEHNEDIPGVFATGGGVWEADRVDFRNWGLIFDMGFGRSLVHLDISNTSGRQGIIAFMRGRNEYLPGALCETEPLVCDFWLSCISEMLNAGVDGIDFRVENHGTHTDYYDDYGFNDVVVQECARRGQTDNETIAKVRGDAYTNFLRQAKHLIKSNGKRMRINLNIDWFRPNPPSARRLAYPANIYYDWKRWIDDGLIDEGILRMFQLPFDTVFNDSVSAEMIASCKEKGIPLTVNRYVNPNYPAEFKRVRQDGRFSGFILYETATFLRFDDKGECVLKNDVVAEVCNIGKNPLK